MHGEEFSVLAGDFAFNFSLNITEENLDSPCPKEGKGRLPYGVTTGPLFLPSVYIINDTELPSSSRVLTGDYPVMPRDMDMLYPFVLFPTLI